jgi:sulfate adenylyltransferase large subunit
MSYLGDIERNTAAPAMANAARGVLRFTTAGSVDDGKSTLIGRLLHDTRQIFEDQLAAVERASHKRGFAQLDLSLLTDGLEAEREQGITIDVAYRYFATPRRKFIIADTPGHVQYTRNMATGASTADAAVILADASKGLLEQGKRHLYIAHLLGIRHVIVAVNKMDLVDYSRVAFASVRNAFEEFANKLDGEKPRFYFLPISALKGDMVVERGDRIAWYDGPTLLELLESIDSSEGHGLRPLRFPVQLVRRAAGHGRAYLGRLASGEVSVGEKVVVLPSARVSTVKAIHAWNEDRVTAYAGESVALSLSDEIDISRGDQIADAARPPRVAHSLSATLVWLAVEPLHAGGRYLLKHTSRTVKAKVASIRHIVDVETLEKRPASGPVAANGIAHAVIALQQPVFFDSYGTDRTTGAFILIDELSNHTVAAGMIL